ncbi:MAG: hypothetical protein CVV37_01560 [Nitrospira bacterium HGW-Nitrospira-1]|nr:MAG: hypothetical protein CVV37_01560 [Nitrospira bacterium HGW-Nitrospira-1]
MTRSAHNDFPSFIYKPLCIIILLFGLFGLIWLRSNVVSISYNLRALEEKKTESLKDMKMLLADRAKFISLANIGPSFQGQGNRDYKPVSSEYVFPDRAKVIDVKRHAAPKTHKASLEIKKSSN